MCVLSHFSHVRLFATPWTICSPPDSSVHGILQARILEWVVISSSRRSFRPKDRTCFSCMAGGFFTAEPLGKPSIRQHTQNIANYAHSPLPMLTVFYLWCSEFLLELDHLLPMWLTLSQPFPLLSRGKTDTMFPKALIINHVVRLSSG